MKVPACMTYVLITRSGTYYVYYSVSSFGSQNSGIGLATSPTLDCGSFTDHGSVGVVSKTGSAYNAIVSLLLEIETRPPPGVISCCLQHSLTTSSSSA